MKKRTAKAEGSKSANTLEAAHGEAEAWRKALYWQSIGFELATWRQLLPRMAPLLPDELSNLRALMTDAAPGFEGAGALCFRMMVAEALEARRIRRERGVPIPEVTP
jgi:hypothetical protein